MEISVIIPAYNRAHTLERSIHSVLSQTYRPAEVIVVDDGSTDNTVDIVERFEGIRLLSTPNRGVSAARNTGIAHSTGDWIAFLDSDDKWDSKKLITQVEFHEANPQIKISQTDEIWIRNGRRVNPMEKHQKKGGWIFEDLLPLSLVSPSAAFIKRDLLDSVGPFDETFPVCEDYDMWLRVSKGNEIGFLPQKLIIKYGGHSDQLSKKFWGMDRWRIEAMEKQLNSLEGFAEIYDIKKVEIAILRELCLKCSVLSGGSKKRDKGDLHERYQQKAVRYKKLLSKNTLAFERASERVE